MESKDHQVASGLPEPSHQPSIVCDPDEFRSLFQREGGPTTLDDYLNSDIPQLGLRIVSFKDKTIVCLDWPHTLMDAMGKRALFDAWTLILQGREDEILTPQGNDTDPLASLGNNPIEPHRLASERLSTFGLAQYDFSNILDIFRSQENRMVCVPGAFLTKLREEALTDVESDFLSEGDILCAWWTRLQISINNLSPNTTVVLNNAYSLRKPLAQDNLQASSGPYVSNAIGFLPVLLPAHEISEKSLGYAASAVRDAIRELGTREQVEAFAAMWRTSLGKLPPFFGNSGVHMITFSNWCKAGLYEIDFSATIVRRGEGSRKPGRPSYIQNNQF